MNAAEAFARIRKGPLKMSSNTPKPADPPADAPLPRPATDRPLQEAHSMTSQHDLLASAMSSEARRPHSFTTEDDNDIVENQAVFQASIALRPACYANHGGHKLKGRDGGPRNYPLRAQYCCTMAVCNKAVVSPQSAGASYIRLETRDSRYDLRRWLQTPNSRLCGGEDDRDVDFLKSERFDYCDVLECLLDAIDDIRNEHAHIESLLSYAARIPYSLHFKQPVAGRADPNYLTMEPEHFEGVPRSGLEDDLVDAALEIDYLKGISEAIGRKIFQGKIKAAKEGLWAETQALLKCGVISQQWADNECF
ncbi:hypothetical protein LTR37_002350 [Vermiconidia calcicola]|uniref:Uncharacterized protein n=1 Tax=Vermiconidia calcicola TaxID=1690605 RepID=A0ACC3NTP4_9PEZI|nr:hypothetical protein LTR37_002350 [Vermiconidia calcicola]